jgi:hypothetical protein
MKRLQSSARLSKGRSGSEDSLVLKGCCVVRPCLRSLHGTDVLLFLLNLTRISGVLIFFYKYIIKSGEVRSKFAFRTKRTLRKTLGPEAFLSFSDLKFFTGIWILFCGCECIYVYIHVSL